MNIGKKLREARLQMNMSLDELQQITKIQKRYLMAIEENNFDSMPGTFYVRAFIRQYASAVNLDGEELINYFDGKDLPEDVELAAQYKDLEESRIQIYEEEHENRLFKSLPAIILSLFGLAIVVVVFYAMWQDQKANPMIDVPESTVTIERISDSSTTSESSSSTTVSSTVESSTVESSAEPTATVAYVNEENRLVNMTATDVAAPAKFTFTATTGNSWAGVIINGAYVFQYTVPAGQTQEFELPAGTTAVTIALGASEYMDMKLNGQPVIFNPNDTGIGERNIVFTITYKQ
ncbi:RodZ domain-containing protein [uncultured Enterococcus sp.]|uniref:helix-turn-helix domain-containing protein n=1 Tax=uncultured Enterococcus sp. TaxID=167972 RepID=UPI002AA6CEB2|nr:RodZ domain-containing protein [uncultured Enterococcus sp.]